MRQQICKKIVGIIMNNTGIWIDDYTMNLLSDSLGINIPEFLYILSDIERCFGIPFFQFLEKNDFTKFNIENIVTEIEATIHV